MTQERQTSVQEIEEQVFAELGQDRVLTMYREMLLMRRFEEQAGRIYQMGGKIKGFCHLYIGQEAVAVGATHNLDEHDSIVTAYREHGQALARGLSAEAVMAELYGKVSGSSHGMGGSMHIFDVQKRFFGGWGIVGGHIPTAAGIAFADKYRGNKAATLCFLGDGALHQGAVFETMNMVSLWDLPLVLIIENNRYAMGTALERASAVKELSTKASGFGMEADTFDGQNVFVVYDGIKRAVQRAKAESRPSLLDIKTYRFRGHSMSDPANYRTKEELAQEQDRDPIQHLHNFLVEKGVRTDDELKQIDKEVKEAVKLATKAADEAPQPDLNALYQTTYVDWPYDIEGPGLED